MTGRFDELGSESLDPPVDGDVINDDAALAEPLLDVAVGQAIPQVPAHRQRDHLTWETKARERRGSRAQGHLYQSARGRDRPTQRRPSGRDPTAGLVQEDA